MWQYFKQGKVTKGMLSEEPYAEYLQEIKKEMNNKGKRNWARLKELMQLTAPNRHDWIVICTTCKEYI